LAQLIYSSTLSILVDTGRKQENKKQEENSRGLRMMWLSHSVVVVVVLPSPVMLGWLAFSFDSHPQDFEVSAQSFLFFSF